MNRAMQREVAFAAVTFVACAVFPRPALALQPTTEFLAHAKTWNPRNRTAHATTAQRAAEVGISTGNLLPNFAATGMYTRNQYEVTTASLTGGVSSPGIPTIVIQPVDQLDANLILNVPIINVGNWDRRAAANSTLEGARADEAKAELNVTKDILRDYYGLLGAEAVLLSARRNLEVAAHNVKLARDRKSGGTGSELDVQRAIADEAKAEQNVTAAQLNVNNTRQDLYSLSGLHPEPADRFPEDDLHEEAPVETWIAGTGGVPAVQSAVAGRVTAEENSRAVKAALYPTVSLMGEEKFTNATAFIGGHNAVYLLQLSATWRLDTTISPQVHAMDAAVAAALANEDGVRQAAKDAVFRDWQQIRADIESARSARAQVAAAQLAASLAEERYAGGVATQLDLLQARQDAFSADVARIQADADLAYARMALRLDAGQLETVSR